MEKDTNIIIRINSDLKDEAIKICKDNNISLSSLISAYLEDTVRRNRIPINIIGRINYRRKQERNVLDIVFIKKCLDEIIQKNGKGDIKKVYLFGSYSRGKARNDSDVDLRIEAGDKLSLIDLSIIQDELKEKLGKNVDVVSQDPDKLDPVFYEQIKKEEICLYEKLRWAKNLLY